MQIKQQLMSRLDDAGVLFNVLEEGVQSTSGIVYDKRVMLINASTQTPMGIVSRNYKTVSNDTIFDAFSDALETSGINTDEMDVKVHFANGGAKTMVNFRFPHEKLRVKGDESETIFEIAVLNSFDGSTRYMTKAGGLRMKCLNGMILGSIVGAYSSFHNQTLDVQAGAQKIVGMLQQFKSAERYWASMMKREITAEVGLAIIAQFFGVEQIDREKNGRSVNQVLIAWDRYVKELGPNAYALYNALTDFVSNKRYAADTAATGMLFNQNKLQTVINTAPVFALAA